MDKQYQSAFRHSSFSGVIGIAQEDITPPVGIYARNWAAAENDVAEDIHRPLLLTCLTLQTIKQGTPLVLIAADLGWWKNSEEEKKFRDEILKALSLGPAQLMFCLSHTHSGPSIYRNDASKTGGQFIVPYLKHVREKAIKAAQLALSVATPAILTWHYGKCNLAANRDLPENGGDRIVVGFNPRQTADDTLLVGRVTTEDHDIMATIVNYACHPTTLGWDNPLISPDYVGAMREIVQRETKAPCLFLQGASGNLAPAEQYVGNPAVADKHGRQLGHAVLSTLAGMLPPNIQLLHNRVVESGAPLAVWERTLTRSNAAFSLEKIEVPLLLKPLPSLAAIEQEWQECEDRVLKERLWRKRGIRKAVGNGEIMKVPLWVWRLGDSFLVGQPNEAYAFFQQELRRQLPGSAVAVMNIVNGTIGYLPPEDAYNKTLYPVWQTPFAAGSLELLTKTAVQAVKKMIKNEPGTLR